MSSHILVALARIPTGYSETLSYCSSLFKSFLAHAIGRSDLLIQNMQFKDKGGCCWVPCLRMPIGMQHILGIEPSAFWLGFEHPCHVLYKDVQQFATCLLLAMPGSSYMHTRGDRLFQQESLLISPPLPPPFHFSSDNLVIYSTKKRNDSA